MTQSASFTNHRLILLTAVITRLLLLGVLFMPLIVSTSTFFPFVVGKAVYSRIMIELAFILWVPLIVSSKEFRLPKNLILIAMAIYILVSIVSAIFGVSFNASFWSTYERMQGLLDLIHWFAFSLMLISLFRKFDHWKLLLSVNLTVSILVCLLGIAQYAGLDSFVSLFPINPSNGRVESTLGNATYVGAFSVANLFIATALICSSFGPNLSKGNRRLDSTNIRTRARRRRDRNQSQSNRLNNLTLWRVLWGSALVINLLALVLSGTRGAIIGLVIALLFASLVYLIKGRIELIRKVSLSFLFAFAIVLTAFLGFRDSDMVQTIAKVHPMANRFVNLDLKDPSVVSRWHTWDAGFRASLDKPILGWGPENFIVAWGRYFDESETVKERFDQAHNKIIEELTTRGIIGLGTYLAIWVLAAITVIKSIRNKTAAEQGFILLIASALCAYFAQNLFLFDTLSTYSQFIVLISLLVCINRESWNQSDNQAAENVSIEGKISLLSQRIKVDRSLATSLCLVLSTGAMLFSIYWFNLKPYNAAQHTVQLGIPNQIWDLKKESFEDAVRTAPGLANYPRLLMVQSITSEWINFPLQARQEAFELVEKESVKAIKQEPENWRIYYVLARFYQMSATEDQNRLDKADEFVTKTEELAPGTMEAKLARELSVKLDKAFGR